MPNITKSKREDMMIDGNTGLTKADIVEAVVKENPNKVVAALTGVTGEALENTPETGEIKVGITPITITVDGSSHSGGTGFDLGQKTITENGLYKAEDDNLAGFDEVTVNVPQPTPTLSQITATENGEYVASNDGVDGYSKVTVDVPAKTETLTVTENGAYTPNAGKDGFSRVDVDVEYSSKELEVTANGTYTASNESVDGFSKVVVAVPDPPSAPALGHKDITANGNYQASASDLDGFSDVTVNVEPKLETKSVTENGTYTPSAGKDGFSSVTVDVPPTEPELETTSITENGTYTPSTGKDGFSQVVVNVEPALETKSVTENGTYTPSTSKDGFSSVTVNVPQPALEELSVTSNGTVDAPEGKAYNKVVTNVSPSLETKSVTENGTYTPTEGKDGFSQVVVNVEPKLETKSVTANGTYTPTEGKDGFSSVTVEVPAPTLKELAVEENGNYVAQEGEAYNRVTVNVPTGGGGDVELKSLSVTENGEYRAESGKAYNKVDVNVLYLSNTQLRMRFKVRDLPNANIDSGQWIWAWNNNFSDYSNWQSRIVQDFYALLNKINNENGNGYMASTVPYEVYRYFSGNSMAFVTLANESSFKDLFVCKTYDGEEPTGTNIILGIGRNSGDTNFTLEYLDNEGNKQIIDLVDSSYFYGVTVGVVFSDSRLSLNSLQIRENGGYIATSGNVPNLAPTMIQVDIPEPRTMVLNLSRNGIYTPPEGFVGFNQVCAEVPLTSEKPCAAFSFMIHGSVPDFGDNRAVYEIRNEIDEGYYGTMATLIQRIQEAGSVWQKFQLAIGYYNYGGKFFFGRKYTYDPAEDLRYIGISSDPNVRGLGVYVGEDWESVVFVYVGVSGVIKRLEVNESNIEEYMGRINFHTEGDLGTPEELPDLSA